MINALVTIDRPRLSLGAQEGTGAIDIARFRKMTLQIDDAGATWDTATLAIQRRLSRDFPWEDYPTPRVPAAGGVFEYDIQDDREIRIVSVPGGNSAGAVRVAIFAYDDETC